MFSADFLENLGFQNYWQLTFLILGILIILMNIGLMFINETDSTERQINQRENDQLIAGKFQNSNFLTKTLTWISGTIS